MDRTRRVLGSVVLATTLTAVLAAPAAATAAVDDVQDDCAATVRTEPDGLLDEAGLADVRAAARALEATADVTVHARLLQGTDGTGVDAWAEARLRECESWQQPGTQGDSLARLLVVVVSLDDREIGSYYGAGIAPVLDRVREGVHAEAMGPALADGRYADGLVAGLDAYLLALDTPPESTEPAEPAIAVAVEPSPAPHQDSLTTAPTTDEAVAAPTDEPATTATGLTRTNVVMAVVLGLLAGSGATVNPARRRFAGWQARRRARALREEMTARAYAADDAWDALHAQVLRERGRLDPDDTHALRLAAEVSEATDHVARLTALLEAAPDPDTADDPHAAEAAWTEVSAAVDDVEREQADVATHLQHVERDRASAATTVAQAEAAVDAARGTVQARRAEGQTVTLPDRHLVEADAQLGVATAADPERQPGTLHDAARAATEAATEATTVVERHASIRASAPQRRAKVGATEARATADAAAAWTVLAGLRDGYARSVWDDLADNEAEHAHHASALARLHTELAAADAVDEYDAVDALLDALAEASTQLLACVTEVTARRRAVDEAEAELDAAMQRATAAVDAAQAWLSQRTTTRALSSRITAAGRTLREAATALAQRDPLTALERAHTAERTAVDAHSAAVRDHEQRSRRAREAIADARRDLEKADSYWRTYGYGGDIRDARSSLSAARALLSNGDAVGAEREAVAVARHARTILAGVRRARSSSGSGLSSFGSSGSSFGSSSGGSGGGSSSGGSFGGGGSSSF